MRTNSAWGFSCKNSRYKDRSCWRITQPSLTKNNQSFLSPITHTHAKTQSTTTQMGSQPGHCKGVTINRAIAICLVHNLPGSWATILLPLSSTHKGHYLLSCWCFPHFGGLSFLDQTMLEIFQRQKLQYFWLENFTCLDGDILVHV